MSCGTRFNGPPGAHDVTARSETSTSRPERGARCAKSDDVDQRDLVRVSPSFCTVAVMARWSGDAAAQDLLVSRSVPVSKLIAVVALLAACVAEAGH